MKNDFIKKHAPVGALLLMLILVQLLLSGADKSYYMTQLTMSAYYAVVVIGLCLLMGYAGQISIGHAGFFAIGGYISASLTTHNLISLADNPVVTALLKIHILTKYKDLYGADILSVTPWAAFAAAVVVAVGAAFLIGIPVIKLKGHYLAMATLGFGMIIYQLVLGIPFFGEADGISSVPAFNLIPGLQINGAVEARIENYYIAWGLVIIALVLSRNIIDSRIGRALRSIHGSEEASDAMGVNVNRYKLHTFVLSAVLASVAGVFMTHFNGGIGPSEASVIKSVRYVAIVAIGGMTNLWGALLMAVVLNFLSLRGVFGSYDDAVFGLILVTIMIFSPRGLIRRDRIRPVLVKLYPLLMEDK